MFKILITLESTRHSRCCWPRQRCFRRRENPFDSHRRSTEDRHHRRRTFTFGENGFNDALLRQPFLVNIRNNTKLASIKYLVALHLDLGSIL